MGFFFQTLHDHDTADITSLCAIHYLRTHMAVESVEQGQPSSQLLPPRRNPEGIVRTSSVLATNRPSSSPRLLGFPIKLSRDVPPPLRPRFAPQRSLRRYIGDWEYTVCVWGGQSGAVGYRALSFRVIWMRDRKLVFGIAEQKIT